MAELFATGRIVDCIVAFMFLEFAALAVLRRSTRRGLPPAALLAMLGAGAALLLSLRAALTDASWRTVALWLLVALVAHLIDLKMRWSSQR